MWGFPLTFGPSCDKLLARVRGLFFLIRCYFKRLKPWDKEGSHLWVLQLGFAGLGELGTTLTPRAFVLTPVIRLWYTRLCAL
jgi:hypothetical protein